MEHAVTAFAQPIKNRVYKSVSSCDHCLFPVAVALIL